MTYYVETDENFDRICANCEHFYEDDPDGLLFKCRLQDCYVDWEASACENYKETE